VKFTNGEISPALKMTRTWTQSPCGMCAGKAAHVEMCTWIPQGEGLGTLPAKDQKSPRRGINSESQVPRGS